MSDILTITREHVSGILTKDAAPAAFCGDGDTVVFETRDCYDDAVVSEERPLGDKADPIENPATGPLYVKGAEPGDVLKVEILDIRLRDWGVMRSSTMCGVFHEDFTERTARIFPIYDGEADDDRKPGDAAGVKEIGSAEGRGSGIDDDRCCAAAAGLSGAKQSAVLETAPAQYITFDDKLTIPLDPMIGVIGTAPAGAGITTDTPESHGGNMDCHKIVKGSTLYLPVNTPGGLLSMGDLHALMGDGEVFICGLEIAGWVTVRVSVVKGEAAAVLPTPFLACRGRVTTIQSAETLDEAGDMAAKAMKEFVKKAAGKDNFEAGMLMSLLSDMAVCQVVDPLKTVRVEFPLGVLETYGYRLP